MADQLSLTNQTPRLTPGSYAYGRPEIFPPEPPRYTMPRDTFMRSLAASDPASIPGYALPLTGKFTMANKYDPKKSLSELQYEQDTFSFAVGRSKVVEDGTNGPLTTRGNAGRLIFGSPDETLLSMEGLNEENAEKRRKAGKIEFQEKDGLGLSAAAEEIRFADGTAPTRTVNLAANAPTKGGKIGLQLKDKVDATGEDAAVGLSYDKDNGDSVKIAAGQTTFKDGTAPTTNLSLSSTTLTKEGKLGVDVKSKVDATSEEGAVGITIDKGSGRSYKLIAGQTTFNDGKSPTTNVEFSTLAPTNSGKLGLEAKSKRDATGADSALGFSVEREDGKSVKITGGRTTFTAGTAPTTNVGFSAVAPVKRGKLSFDAKNKVDATGDDMAVGVTYERDNGRTLKVTAGQTTFNDGTASTVLGDAVLTIPTHEGKGKVEAKVRGKRDATGNEVAAKLAVEREAASLELGASRTVVNQVSETETDLFKMTAAPMTAMDAKLTVPMAEGKLSFEGRLDRGAYRKTTGSVQYERNGHAIGLKGTYSPNAADAAAVMANASTPELQYKGLAISTQVEAGAVRSPQGKWEPAVSGTFSARPGQSPGEVYVKADAVDRGLYVGYRMNF